MTPNPTPENPPAFPQPLIRYDGDEGMRLRDWFAGQALNGAMTGVTGLAEIPREEKETVLRRMSELLYEIADAMLRAREETK